MPNLIVLMVVGLVAQLVDGSLGMGYGASSASLLLAAGVAPALASSTVHLAEVVTTVASGAWHWRFGNVDRRLVLMLALPGGVGAFLGAVLLASVPAQVARPAIAVFLCALGLIILIRFARRPGRRTLGPARPVRRAIALPLGLVAGFFDASGGGGWGSISTSTLMAQPGMAPRQAIGSVSASEPVVAIAASAGFVATLGWQAINLPWIGALIGGGLVAAPVAAWLVSRLPQQALGSLVAAAILFTNAHTLTRVFAVDASVSVATYAAIGALWLAVVGYARLRPRPATASMPMPSPTSIEAQPAAQ